MSAITSEPLDVRAAAIAERAATDARVWRDRGYPDVAGDLQTIADAARRLASDIRADVPKLQPEHRHLGPLLAAIKTGSPGQRRQAARDMADAFGALRSRAEAADNRALALVYRISEARYLRLAAEVTAHG